MTEPRFATFATLLRSLAVAMQAHADTLPDDTQAATARMLARCVTVLADEAARLDDTEQAD